MDLQTALSIILTAFAILVSAFLGMVGFWINSRQKREEQRLIEIEKFVESQKNELFGVRFISARILEQNNNLYSHSDKLRRVIIKLIREKNEKYKDDEIDRLIKLVDEHTSSHLHEAKRVSLYADILVSREDEIEGKIGELREKFLDVRSLEFLEALTTIEQGTTQEICKDQCLIFRSELGRISASSWTGI